MSSIHMLREKVLASAKKWWFSNRPRDWGLKEHLTTPAFGTTTEAERNLARAVAELAKEEWRTDGAEKVVADLYGLARDLEKNNWRTSDFIFRKHEIYRHAESFLGKRSVSDDTTPPPQGPRRLPKRRNDGAI